MPPLDSALGGSPTETPSIDTLDKFLAEDFGQWARDDRCSPSTAEELGRYQAVVVAVLREDSEQNAADIAAFKQILQYVDAYEDCQSSARDTIDAIEDEAYARVSASSSQETPNG